MSKEEAMKLAQMLDALIQKYSDKLYDGTGAKAANDFELDVAAIRLTFAEQPAQQEPVAWMGPNGGMLTANYIDKFASGLDKEIHSIPLYTTPQAQPAREPLTVDQIRGIYEDCDAPTSGLFAIAFARAIEAAQGITKGNT